MMSRESLVAVFYICVVTIILVPNFITMKKIEKRQVHMENGIPQVKQWYLSDTPVSMNVKSAWRDGYTGKGVLVAVVDDGANSHHPDLKSNFNFSASYDFLEDRDVDTNHNPGDHGTSCAGIIAGADNSVCGVGVAFGAQISSVRIFGENTPSTEQLEAKALSFQKDMIDVYSNSWGPGDSGWELTRLGPRLKETLEKGTRLGRHGKGSIFVFAAGNGGINGDSCAFNGYVNSIHTIAISGVNWDGSVPAYAEPCAAIMAVTYGQDVFAYKKPSLITAKGADACTQWFPGSSSSTAFASGIIALALQANPDLTWRDIQHLIARSSKPLNPQFTRDFWQITRPRPRWRKNKANLTVSNDFGFGLMDAGNMIKYAEDWSSVPKQLSCEVKLDVSSSKSIIPSSGDLHLTLSVKQDDCSIQYLEHVQVEVDLRFHRRGNLEMFSTCPSGTQSKLLYSRRMDIIFGNQNLTNWRVTSLHYWGEKPTGDWTLTIRNTSPRSNVHPGRTGHVFGLKLILFGTKDDPLKNNTHVDRRPKEAETVEVSRRKREFVTHGGYSRWSRWYPCSLTCGHGTQKRYRSCNNPWPENGGRNCNRLGKAEQSRKCYPRRCPVNGGYSNWGSWSECDVKCGVGYKQRTRTCTNPAPAHGGRYCYGEQKQRWKCQLKACPLDCGRPLIASPGNWYRRPSYVLNEKSAWCTGTQRYLQVHLGRIYKLTAIATQGGGRSNAWMKRYRITFNAGATPVSYSETGSEKAIKGNEDSSSVVTHQFKEPFVTKLVRIYPDVMDTSSVCVRMELYGCDPDPDCILVGSLFWGLWTRKDSSHNYYKAYITKVNVTHLDFALEFDKAYTRSYNRTDQVLITDEAVEIKDISVNSRVIAVHRLKRSEWYRTGTITLVSRTERLVQVKFDDGQHRWVSPDQVRLVKRPVYCKNNI